MRAPAHVFSWQQISSGVHWSARFTQVTHDKFFILVEAIDPKFSDTETRRLLERAGSTHIEEVRD